MGATVKDIARQVGLSVTTVSRALNDHADVAQTTKARIRAAADALDYHPNAAARSLQNNRSNALGLVIPLALHRSYDAFWLEFIGGMAASCARHGVDLLLSAAEGEEEGPQSFQRLVRSRRVDGLVLCDIRADEPRIRQLQKLRVPFVAFGRTTEQADYSYIDVDGAAGSLEGMQHLTRLGHRRIAYLGLDPTFGFSYFRLAGYREAFQQPGLQYDPDLVFEGLTEETAPVVADKLCTMVNRPTAVLTAADFLALAVLRAARAHGLAVPDDLSVVVFDDNLPVQHADPPLTAIRQPNRQLGEESGDLLLQRVRNPDAPPVQRLMKPALIVRSSTRAVLDDREELGKAGPTVRAPNTKGVISKTTAT